MIAQLSPDLVRDLEQIGDEPLPVENPLTKRLYVLVDVEQFDVIRRPPVAGGDGWSESKNERRCALIRKKFAEGIDAAENYELAQLQDEVSAFRQHKVALPYDVVDALRAALDLSSPTPTTSAS